MNLDGVALAWDERCRLVKVDGASSSAKYEYDVLGRCVSRIEHEIPNPASAITNWFVHDGNQVVADLDGEGNLLRTYVWGPGIDNLLCFTDHATSNTYYAIKDHQNAVIALVDEAGAVVESYEYDAWGNPGVFDAAGSRITNGISQIGNRYMFQGREYDATTGLYCFRARWYDPETGRWLSKDPIGISGGLNLYVFCGNNPVNFIDPSGLADLTFLHSSDPAYSRVPRGPDGVTTITGHGTPTTVRLQVGDINSTTRLSGTQAGVMYRGSIPDSDVVILYMCRTGQGSFADDFAKATGNTVIAPLGYVGVSGKVYKTMEDAEKGVNPIPPSQAWRVVRGDGKGGCNK